MRIALVSYEYPGVTTNCGGGGRVVDLLARGLNDRGHETRVITDPGDGHYATFPARRYRDIRESLTAFDPDVVHGCFSLPSSLALPRLTAKQDVPFICSVMGADVHDPTRYRFIRPVMRLANTYIFNRADRVVTPSTDMHERVATRFGCDSKIIHYGLPTSNWRWRSRPEPGHCNVLTVCRPVPRKNMKTAFQALSHYRTHHDNALSWRIVGDSNYRALYEQQFGDAEWVTFRGRVDDLQAEFDWGDVFFLPSHHEAFGMVFLEALACGLPVITSASGGQSDIVRCGVGTTVRDGDAMDYAWALRFLLDSYGSYQRATRDYVADQFHIGDMVREYESLYREVTDAERTTEKVRA